MQPACDDQNLLTGVIAVQLGLIPERTFLDASSAWSTRQDVPFVRFLEERGDLSPEGRRRVEQRLRELDEEDSLRTLSLSEAGSERAPDVTPPPTDRELRDTSYDTIAPRTRDAAARRRKSRDGPRYTLTKLHAQGGLGTVWLARDTQLNRDVALKEIRSGVSDQAEMRQRFLQEAQVTGQLEHPNIVPVYELSHRPLDGQPFYTMRFVRGRTLRQAIAEEHERRRERTADPLGQLKLLQIFVSIGQAVSYAHSRGVIHRDLKPENVVLGNFGEVILLDWGLAKVLGGVSEPTASGNFPEVTVDQEDDSGATVGHVGTPAYMAPEQAEARHDLVDARTDVYGLGAVLFEILTGRPPHEGRTTAEVLNRIVSGDTPRARDVNPDVPAPLDAICARAMAFLPAQRYQKASELTEDVHRWIADEPVTAYRESRCQRAARWLRKHRATLTGMIAVGVTAVSIAIALLSLQVYRKTLRTSELRETLLTQEQAIARQREFYRLYHEARSERSERTPGWTTTAEPKLKAAAAIRTRLAAARQVPDALLESTLKSLRDEVLAGLLTVDVDTHRTFPLDVSAECVSQEFALSPDGLSIAVFGKHPLRQTQFEGGLYSLNTGARTRPFSFEPKSGPILSFLDGEREVVNGVAISPDGRWLALATSGGQVHCWDLHGADPHPRTIAAHHGPVRSLVFSTDSRTLFSTGEAPDPTLRKWPLRPSPGFRPELSRSFSGKEWIGAAVLSADGSALLVATEQGLHTLDPETLEGPVRPRFPFEEFAVSPDGLTLVGHDARLLHLYPVNGGNLRSIAEPYGYAHRAQFRVRISPNADLIASFCQGEGGTGKGRNIKVWEVASHQRLVTIPVSGREEFDVRFTADGRHLVFVTNGQINIRKINGYAVQSATAHTTSPLTAAAWSPDGRAILGVAGEAAGPPGTFHLEATHWDLLDPLRRETRTLDLHGAPAAPLDRCGLASRPDGSLVALTTAGKLHLWERPAGSPSRWRSLDLPRGRAELAFSRDGKTLWGLLTGTGGDDQLFTIGADGTNFEVVYRDPSATQVLLSRQAGLNCLASGAGRVVVGGMNDYHLFEEADRRRIPKSWPVGRDQVYSVALSGDGVWVALGLGTGQVVVQDLSDDCTLQLSEPYLSRVGAVALNGDGRLLASGSDDTTIRIHVNDGTTLLEVLQLPPQSAAVVGLSFSPDGSNLLIRVENEYAVRVLHLGRLRDRLRTLGLGW